MKILELKLTAFGPFTGHSLDLSDGQEGLHIIYGPNEAGKSSALRAIGDFFYGIPPRTDDNFVHPYQRLRIGGRLEHSGGTVLEAVRRKGNQNTLRQSDDTAPLDEDELRQFLGDVDRDLFHVMFGLNHIRLRRGGEEIVQGGGEIGRLLFVAGAGLADLQGVQQRLQNEIDQLFKSTGRSGAILSDIKEYQKARSDLKNAQVSVETWNRHDEDLRHAENEMKDLDKAIRERSGEQNRLVRIRDAVSTIARWRKATEELESLREAPLLADDFEDTSNKILIDLRKAETQQDDASTALKGVKTKLDALCVPEYLLAEANAIESLRDRLGGHRKAMSDRPKLETSRAIAEGEAKEILRKLGRAPDLAVIEELRLPADKTVRIQNLGNQQEGLVERLQAANQDCERLRRDIARAENKLKDINVPDGASLLREKIRQIQQEGDLESQLSKLKNKLRGLDEDASVKLKQLSLWSGSLEEAENLPVPSIATIERFDQGIKDAEARLQSLRDQQDKENQAIGDLDRQLKELELEQSVPTQDELSEARRVREEGWQLVRAAWKDGNENSENIDDFVKQFSPLQTLPDAYQRSVEEADRVADTLRHDADRVATKAKLKADRDQRDRTCKALNTDIESAREALKDVQEDWKAQWTPLNLSPLTPLEMRDWLRQQQDIAQLASSIRDERLDADQLQDRIETLHAELSSTLDKVQPHVERDAMSLRDLLLFASDASDEIQRAENQLSQIEETLESDRSDLDGAESRFQKAEAALKKWQLDWANEMRRLGLEENAIPSQANSVLTDISDLFQKFQDADRYRTRIEGIDRESNDFEEDVRELAKRIAPDLEDHPAEETVNLLSTRLQDARSAQVTHDNLVADREKQEEKLRGANETISEVTAELDEMCRQAGCQEHEELAQAARQSTRRKQLEQLVEDLEEQLVGQSGGAKLESFVSEADAESRDIDSLQPRIDELGQEIERMNETRDQVLREVEREEGLLRAIDGSAVAAEKAAKCESVAARIEEQLYDLAVLRVASAILNAGIEKHRQKNEGPVLGRASQVFSKITLGAFEGLRADYNERGEPILTGVRGNGGDTINVSGMSDGTCDQLYLALRLASLETWFERHEPIPFILDDVLLNFDDDRAKAAIQVLAELSTHTQVIFFTHHNHLVDMAKDSLSEKELFVHCLEA